jgi:general secretion pathway protein A
MYEEYWKLKEKPFENNFDLKFIYLSLQYEEVITRLMFIVREKRKGAFITGYYGSGKSLILEYFITQLSELEEPIRVIHISDPMMSMTDFHREFIRQFGAEFEDQQRKLKQAEGVPQTENPSHPRLLMALKDILVKIQDEGGHTVLLIDEATLIPAETMEELRLLLDLYHPETQKSLISMILSGPFSEPDLPAYFNNPALRQRLPLKCHVGNLDEEQCGDYIKHRLEVAGQPNQLFTDEAIEMIARRSNGAPRSINNICDLALFLAFSQNSVRIDTDVIDLVTQEIGETLSES